MILVALKLVLTPLLIGGASLGARRWGPVIGGWMVSLPLTSGPVALFLALDRGPSFAATAAEASVAGNVAIVAFCLAYARVATRTGWPAAIAAAGIGWLAAALALQPALALPVGVLFLLVASILVVALRVMPVGTAQPSGTTAPGWDLPLRVVVGTGVVFALTAAAPTLGSSASGLLAMLPVIATVLVTFTHRHEGADPAIGLLRGILTGLFGNRGVSRGRQRLDPAPGRHDGLHGRARDRGRGPAGCPVGASPRIQRGRSPVGATPRLNRDRAVRAVRAGCPERGHRGANHR